VKLALGIAHVELDEGARQLLYLPGRAGLAGAQADDDVADPHRLAGLERQIAGEAVALVEQAQNRDPLRHRSRARHLGGDGLRNVDRPGLGRGLIVSLPLGRALGPAGGERGEAGEEEDRPGAGRRRPVESSAGHGAPGVQAS
jgi:hypothetical protein